MALLAITGCANSTSRPRPTVASPLSLVPTSDAIADDLPSVTVNANFDRFELQVRFEAIQMVDLAGGVTCSTDTDSASGQLTTEGLTNPDVFLALKYTARTVTCELERTGRPASSLTLRLFDDNTPCGAAATADTILRTSDTVRCDSVSFPEVMVQPEGLGITAFVSGAARQL